MLSTAYAMVMMAVIVGTALQLGEDGIASPSSIFLMSLTGSMTIAAVLHPQVNQASKKHSSNNQLLGLRGGF